jgi:serine/threonine protein phosphatase PrpC/CRP-like cAMP-binding protein
MKFGFAAATDVGRKRDHNEDAMFADASLGLFVVCDGMGGHAAGEVASAMAVSEVTAGLRRQLERIRNLMKGDLASRREAATLFASSAHAANAAVYAAGESNPAQRGMGTTLTALLLVDDRALVLHVGDSRLYLVRNGQSHQITEDHTLATELLRTGRTKEQTGASEANLAALTKAVGVYPHTDVDTLEIHLLPDDRFLLCSDGLHGYMDDFNLSTFLAHSTLPSAPSDLIAFANRQGGRDNITAISIFTEPAADTAANERTRLTFNTLRAIPLFQYLSFNELIRLIPVCQAIEVKEGATVLHEGEESGDFYVVLSGRLRVHTGVRELAVLDAGQHFGEMSLVDSQPRSASVAAMTDALLLRIGRTEFYEVMRQDSVMAVKLLWNFIQTLSGLVREQKELHLETVAVRAMERPYTRGGSLPES